MIASVSPNKWGLTFHHLGLAAKDPEAAAEFLLGLGYAAGDTVYDPLQNVHLRMCEHARMPAVEIISPGKGEGPLDKMLAAHKSGLVYHMCFSAENLAQSLEKLESDENVRLFAVSPPKPAILFGGKRVSFYLIEGTGLIEIIDEAA